MSEQTPDETESPDTNVILLIGPPAIGKKHFMLALKRKYPAIFHIARTLTTKLPESDIDLIFFDDISESEFYHHRDNEERFFWATYEKVKPGDDAGTFLFGYPRDTIEKIPVGQYALIAISSPGHYDAFFDYLDEEDKDAIRVYVVRLSIGPALNNQEDVLSRNLRAMGADDEEINRKIQRAKQLDYKTHGIADESALVTGNDKADLRQLCDILRAFAIIPEYE